MSVATSFAAATARPSTPLTLTIALVSGRRLTDASLDREVAGRERATLAPNCAGCGSAGQRRRKCQRHPAPRLLALAGGWSGGSPGRMYKVDLRESRHRGPGAGSIARRYLRVRGAVPATRRWRAVEDLHSLLHSSKTSESSMPISYLQLSLIATARPCTGPRASSTEFDRRLNSRAGSGPARTASWLVSWLD
jgi:hypothetical protein